jgi:hypothetical protein
MARKKIRGWLLKVQGVLTALVIIVLLATPGVAADDSTSTSASSGPAKSLQYTSAGHVLLFDNDDLTPLNESSHNVRL